MSLQRGLTTYRQTQVQSRTPLELVVMLYDGALTFLHQARAAIERGDIAARRDASSRAIAIISELQSTLNMEQGGEIAQRLDDLYVYVNGRIIAAAAENRVGPIDDATRVLTVLRESWVAIATPAAEAPVRGAA
ncbi:MAG: flagellar export chaperone FliS [Acidobacteria bacterium]|nr:flagellar export chaperone FliS [Acidobacteriota bacterium]